MLLKREQDKEALRIEFAVVAGELARYVENRVILYEDMIPISKKFKVVMNLILLFLPV